jgi:hypothetical protein
VVWPCKVAEDEAEEKNIHRFSQTQRCVCRKHKQQLIQCGHELKVLGFRLRDWDHRWFTNRTYCREVQSLFETGFFGSSNRVGDLADPNAATFDDKDSHTFETNDVCAAEMVSLTTNGWVVLLDDDEDTTDDVAPNLTHSRITLTFNAIVSHVQHDGGGMGMLQPFAKGVLEPYRRGLDVSSRIFNKWKGKRIPTSKSRPLSTTSRQVRKNSYVEVNRGRSTKRLKIGGRRQTSWRKTTKN